MCLFLHVQIDDAQREFLGFTISSMSVFGVSFLLASFIIFLVQEKESKVSDRHDTATLV